MNGVYDLGNARVLNAIKGNISPIKMESSYFTSETFNKQTKNNFEQQQLTGKWKTVISGYAIPANTIIGPVPFALLKPMISHLKDELDYCDTIEVRLSNSGTFIDLTGSPSAWIPFLQGARDCSELNLEICEIINDIAFLRTYRPVSRGQPLLVWFGELCSFRLGLPILTSQNIRGNRQYRCHKCEKVFGFPNVLKAHLMLEYCTPSNLSISRNLNEFSFFYNKTFSSSFPFLTCPLLPIPQSFSIFSQSFTLPSLGKPTAELNSLLANPIAVPFRMSSPNKQLVHKCQKPLTVDTGEKNIKDFSTSNDLSLRHLYNDSSAKQKLFNTPPSLPSSNCMKTTKYQSSCHSKSPSIAMSFISTSTEPLDLIPRSLYTTKCNSGTKGHLCIYCGKLYSRKYGLKIHLRTHTGYKPLKCKICMRPFGDPSNLNKHVRLHAEGDTPYRCDFCGKVLVRRRDLERHIRSRHSATTVSQVITPSPVDYELDAEFTVDISWENDENDIAKSNKMV